MPRCYLALGGNVGPVEATFESAVAQLDRLPQITLLEMSRVYRSAAVGENAGDDFLNATAEIEADLRPLELLDELERIESALGRTREADWGPRTLDLDLLLYAEEIIDEPRLRVPHPACWYRRFVLDPLVEIAADVIHPERRTTIGKLRSRLLVRPFRMALAGADHKSRAHLIAILEQEFPEVEFRDWDARGRSQGMEPTLLVWLGQSVTADFRTSGFDLLRRICRLDASAIDGEPATFLRHVLQSALNECEPIQQ